MAGHWGYRGVGAAAMASLQATIGAGTYRRLFPKLTHHGAYRPAYIGGWNHCSAWNREVQGVDGRVYDVNSQYPSQLIRHPMPYGQPVAMPPHLGSLDSARAAGRGFIVRLECEFELRAGFFPFIPSDNLATRAYRVSGTDTLTLCDVDYELFLAHYKVNLIRVCAVWSFSLAKNIFSRWVRRWYAVKSEAEKAGDAGKRQHAKLTLDSLVGKFGARDGTGYVPVAIYVNAYSRQQIMKYAQINRETFLYSSTDSLHLSAPGNIPVSDRIGDFKIEREFNRAKYLAKGVYLEYGDIDGYCATLAGATPSAVEYLLAPNDPDLVFARFSVGEVLPNTINGLNRPYTLGDTWQF